MRIGKEILAPDRNNVDAYAVNRIARSKEEVAVFSNCI